VLEELEPEAGEATKGLWEDPQPMPQWEWRKRSRRAPLAVRLPRFVVHTGLRGAFSRIDRGDYGCPSFSCGVMLSCFEMVSSRSTTRSIAALKT